MTIEVPRNCPDTSTLLAPEGGFRPNPTLVDMNDADLLALETSTSVDDSIMDAMRAGADFRAAFREFDDFRQHFANAQVPSDSQRPVSETTRETYVARLVAELQASLGARREVNVRVDNHDRRTFVNGHGNACRSFFSNLALSIR